jgi:hypothetical protein
MQVTAIYHLAPTSELRSGVAGDAYRPRNLAADGFVHCAGSPEVALAVAGDYFGDLAEPLIALVIDPGRLGAELRFEAPAPRPGGGRAHLARADLFPHVYGAIDRAAIREAGRLGRDAAGYRWPERFEPLEKLLAGR